MRREHGAAILAFLVTVAFSPKIIGAATVPREALLSVGIPLLLLGPVTSPRHWQWLAAFLFWQMASLAWTPVPLGAIGQAWDDVLLALVVIVGASLEEIAPAMLAIAAGLGVSSVIVVAQVLGWHGWPEAATPSGLFINKDVLAEVSAIVLVWFAASRLWWAIPLLLPDVLLTSSHAAFAAFGAALVAWLLARRRLFWASVACLGGVAAVVLVPGSAASSAMRRIEVWEAALRGISLFGHGVGSFPVLVYTLTGNPHVTSLLWGEPHNEVLNWAFESGIGAFLPFVFLFLVMRDRHVQQTPEATALVAAAVIAFVSFPLHVPLSLLVVGLLAGRAARPGNDLRHGHAGVGDLASVASGVRQSGRQHRDAARCR